MSILPRGLTDLLGRWYNQSVNREGIRLNKVEISINGEVFNPIKAIFKNKCVVGNPIDKTDSLPDSSVNLPCRMAWYVWEKGPADIFRIPPDKNLSQYSGAWGSLLKFHSRREARSYLKQRKSV